MNGSTWITTHGSRQLDQLVELRAHDRGTAHHVQQHTLVQDVPEHRAGSREPGIACRSCRAPMARSIAVLLSRGLPALTTAFGNALLEATTYHLGMSADAHEKPDIFVPADVVVDPGDASAAWRRALKELLGDKQRFDSWRKQRYAFAHRVGTLLTEAHPPAPAATGPALYGVYLPGTGLCYVGQTQEARRRLRDLPIGESHHLAMTAPPELWARVIVVQWAELLVRATEREWVIPDMKACGQALEYLLHCHFRPTINCYARTTDGSYRERPPERSKSKAALGAIEYSDLFKVVLRVWSSLEAVPEPAPGEFQVADYRPFGRVIFPAALLDSGDFQQA